MLLGKPQRVDPVLGVPKLTWETRLKLLASAWHNHLGSERSKFCLLNKLINLWGKKKVYSWCSFLNVKCKGCTDADGNVSDDFLWLMRASLSFDSFDPGLLFPLSEETDKSDEKNDSLFLCG